MITSVREINVPNVYTEALMAMHMIGKEEDSRNGRVLTIQDPFYLTILNPQERVLFDPIRDANPFFHVMEFVWMMAGSKDVRWIEKFNSKYRQYADTGTHVVHGAYGYRWRDHFGSMLAVDQIVEVIELLKRDPTTRRAVLGMWDPSSDLEFHADVPCNTHIYFRFSEGALHMTVCNRSNDILWGMLGANVVHMTYLHELVAHGAGLPLGEYRVFSNNAHVYTDLPRYKEIMNTRAPVDYYTTIGVGPMPLMQKGESYEEFLTQCAEFLHSDGAYENYWLNNVARPMRKAYLDKEKRDGYIEQIEAPDWQLATKEWWARRK
jgi:hypothetical protein